MNMKKLFSLSMYILVILLCSCGAQVNSKITKSYPTLAYNEEVIVFGLNDDIPMDVEHLGTVKVGDSGFSTQCNYETVLDQAKLEARKVGGNAIKIMKHNKPNIWSSCHRITVEVLRVTDH